MGKRTNSRRVDYRAPGAPTEVKHCLSVIGTYSPDWAVTAQPEPVRRQATLVPTCDRASLIYAFVSSTRRASRSRNGHNLDKRLLLVYDDRFADLG